MIKTVYIGQQVTNNMDISRGLSDVSVKNMGNYITFTGIDITRNQINLDNPAPGTGMVASKIDMLFYHRLSDTGNILSSVVYMGGPTLIGNKAEHTYVPKQIYKNTQFEVGIGIPDGAKNFKIFNSTGMLPAKTPAGNDAIFRYPDKTLSDSGLPAVVISDDSIAQDGWYSIMSVGLCDTGVSAGFVKKGMLLQDDDATVDGVKPWYSRIFAAKEDGVDPSDLYNEDLWESVSDWTTEASLAGPIANYFPYNPWVRRDIFWMAQYDRIYRDSVIDYVEKDWSGAAPYPHLRAIHSSIDWYASKNKYDKAQSLLQGTDYYRTTYNFLANV